MLESLHVEAGETGRDKRGDSIPIPVSLKSKMRELLSVRLPLTPMTS